MRVAIVGAGYVGLVSGACLAERGHEVVCIDVDATKVDAINRAHAPIFEAGLNELLQKNVPQRFSASSDFEAVAMRSELVLVAVGTPLKEDVIDLSYIIAIARQLAEILRKASDYKVIVIKSTVVPGTTSGIVRKTLEEGSGKTVGVDFGLAMNPEFLTEGTAVRDFMNPDRIVLGAADARSAAKLEELYASFTDVPRVRTNNNTAELIKYASNALLATSISFANEMSRIAQAVGGIDVVDVQQGVRHSTYLTSRGRAGEPVVAGISSFLEAGCGFGGSCLPKDVAALIAAAYRLGVDTPLLKGVLEVNKTQPLEMMRLVKRHYSSLAGVRVLVLGLSFKPDTDDVRESPAFPLIQSLEREGAEVSAYDPVAINSARSVLRGVATPASLDEAVRNVQVIMLVTKWDEFRRLPQLIENVFPAPLVIDGRRLLSPDSVARYEGIGR